MGWAKYDEDIREVVEERMVMKGNYLYAGNYYDYCGKEKGVIGSYGSYKKETRIVKRPH